MYQEDPLDRFSRLVLAWMIFTERTIEIESWHLWRMSYIKVKYAVRRLWIELYYHFISPTLMFIGLKRTPSWTEIEEEVKELEAETGQPFPRTAAHIEGLKREQAKKE
jgi:hypothetical protein